MQRRLFLFAADFRKTGSAEVFLPAALRARSGICDVCRNMCESCVCRQAQWTFHGLTEFTTFWKNVSGVGKNRRVFPLSPYLMPWRALRLRWPCWMSRPILRRGFFCRVELDQIRFRGGSGFLQRNLYPSQEGENPAAFRDSAADVFRRPAVCGGYLSETGDFPVQRGGHVTGV